MRISIHAPREGSDLFLIHCRRSIAISIHAPREGSDRRTGTKRKLSFYFNPRSPWRERLNGEKIAKYNSDFNPRSPWRERHDYMDLCLHLLQFQSTLPVKGATLNSISTAFVLCISIHAPREGSDLLGFSCRQIHLISIHAPREGSDGTFPFFVDLIWDFNPRSPWRERPKTFNDKEYTLYISIHAPREGSDNV